MIYLIVALVFMVVAYRYEEHLGELPPPVVVMLALVWPFLLIIAAIIYIPRVIRFVARIGR
jgi:hypothetical protein